MVSVGSTTEVEDKIEPDASLIKWATRLSGLSNPVKMQTMDYMTSYILA